MVDNFIALNFPGATISEKRVHCTRFFFRGSCQRAMARLFYFFLSQGLVLGESAGCRGAGNRADHQGRGERRGVLELATHIIRFFGGERAPTQAAGSSPGDEPILVVHSKGLPAVPRLRASPPAGLPV